MIRIEYINWLVGALLTVVALLDVRARRPAHAAFWGILAACFLGGDAVETAMQHGNHLPAQLVGVGVIALALLAGSGKLIRRPELEADGTSRRASAKRLGNWLFAPALIIPLGTLALAMLQPWLHWGDVFLIAKHRATLIALGVACVGAAVAALALTRASVSAAALETSRLLDALSWAALLPMLLATLGGVFAATGVGEAIAHLTAAAIPVDSRTACLFAYAVGMVAFTVIMGNAFAAFPVMTAGIGLPLLIGMHHANPAALGALGMLSGYCGTLLTPMAANFNIVPVALLELPGPNDVIRAQWPTAAILFVANFGLMVLFVFR
ncbi:MAG TPA: DUF979 family protein [Rudaea sp.]|nr:DUF979 family protein [Rudaea sp.]